MPPELALGAAPARASLGEAWRIALQQLTLAWLAIGFLTLNDWAEMARQWWNASTYNHILLIPFIIVWLVRVKWPELARLTPQGWSLGLAWAGFGLIVWLAGSVLAINLGSQLGAVLMLQGAAAAVLGPKVVAGVLFPLGYMVFLVPFGDEIVPALQMITAHIAVILTQASGVPAHLAGVFIDTPVGLFEVAEACSGIKFLVAMVALGSLAAHLGFSGWRRRILFMAAAVIVPILANGVRAWGTIYIAQSAGVKFAAGFDHIVFGWIFFALVMGTLLGVAWRYFDRSPSDPLANAAAINASARLARWSRHSFNGWLATAIIVAGAAGAEVLSRLGEAPAHAFLAAADMRP